MERILLALTLVALVGCQAGAAPLTATSAPPAATAVEATATPPAPVTPVPRTAAPTTVISPVPSARSTLSDARLATDDRARLIFHMTGEDRLRAIAWTDASNGVLPGLVPLNAYALSSPDGERYILNGKIYERDGRALGTLPWQDPSMPTWSRDGKFLCRALPQTQQTGATMQVQTVVPGEQPRILATGFGIYSDNAGYPVLVCDASTDRVIVVSLGQGLFAGRLWVFRLSTGELISTEALGTGSVGSWLVASADGKLLAHSVREAMTGPTTTTIRTPESPAALRTLPAFEAHGFSGDTSLLLGVTGPNATAIIDWRTARPIWTSTGTTYGGYFSEPGGARFAVGLGFVGGAEEKGEVYIVDRDGSSFALPLGVRVAFSY